MPHSIAFSTSSTATDSGGIVADSAGSSQKNHRRWNFLRQNHGIVTRAAHHAMRIASGLRDCPFYLSRKEWIHRDRRLV